MTFTKREQDFMYFENLGHDLQQIASEMQISMHRCRQLKYQIDKKRKRAVETVHDSVLKWEFFTRNSIFFGWP